MTEQEMIDWKYLQDAIRNGTGNIHGLWKQIEKNLRAMEGAMNAYAEEFENEKNAAERRSDLDS